MTELHLGARDAPYPDGPGHRGTDTSIAAADHLKPHVGRLQAMTLGAIRDAGAHGRTVLELVAALEVDRISLAPRATELRAKHLIIDSGQRRKNPSGVNAIVWILPEFEGAHG